MSEKLLCNNHPNADAIASCDKCDIALCGLCGNYIDDSVFCERCTEIYETKQFISAQSEKLKHSRSTLIVDNSSAGELSDSKSKKSNYKSLQLIVIVASVSVIAVRLYFFSNPISIQRDPELLAREQALTSVVQCLLIFREIGLRLEREGDQTAVAELRCADSDVPNIITIDGDNIRISHPNPAIYGYSEIFVTNHDAEPKLTAL